MSDFKTSRDGQVKFFSDSHVYEHEEYGILQSVTSYIKTFTNIFDASAEAVKYAEKYGLNVNDVLDKWQKKGKESRDAGTAIHKVIEAYVNTGKIIVQGIFKKEDTVKKIIQDFFETERLIPVYCEEIVYNKQLAGQIDMVAKDKNNNHYILDWKTNETISDNSYGKMMRFPYDLMPDANLIHYSLQLKLYEEMLGIEIKDKWIVHIMDKGYKFIRPVEIILNTEIG